MATAVWNGTTGNWSTTANWSGGTGTGGIPGPNDDVVLGPSATGYTLTLDIAATPALDSLTIGAGGGPGAIILAVGANTLNVTGSGAGATDTITLGETGGATISLAGGTVNTGVLAMTSANGAVSGFGALTAINIAGAGRLLASGGTLAVSGTINAGVGLAIDGSTASDLAIFGTATAASAILVANSNQTLEIGASGSLTINAAETIGAGGGGTIKLDGGTLSIGGGNALTIASGASLTGLGTVNAASISGAGTLVATGGTLTLVQNLSTTSGITYDIAGGSMLQLGGSPNTGNVFTFLSAANGTLGVIETNDTAISGDSISGMDVGLSGARTNFIDIEGMTVTATGSGSTSSGTITLSDGATLNLANITLNGVSTWFANTISDGAGGTDVFISDTPCFCRGTRIATDRGEIAVEDLAVGDRVKTLSGSFKPIVWIGFGRSLVTRTNRLARPIVVRRGALAENVPQRDLYLTHGHALYFDGVLIPVENLINYRSILWDDTARVVEYYHIELEDHDVMFAEGAPAESYYDARNRALFHNTRPGSEPGAAEPNFAPVLNGGERVDQVWAALYERAGGQFGGETTTDPDLHLVVDGKRLDAASVEDRVFTFAFETPPAGDLLLCSRSGVPSLLGISRHDHRQLGVAISRIELREPGITTAFEPDSWLFRDGGCHPAESSYCWTDGECELPGQAFAHVRGAFTLMVHTERPGMRYPMSALVAKAA